ncbi:hypothetical protein [Thermobrachium celere]|uniref:hypothetical protein n=1 Tax=Thermobrachium celere TaxID=53422 RepID=UPI0019458B80|nr:hypothetical protein [Thermobrachium celere]GFR35349.1 hypothetical protein TCEA9_11610 [Thermobrachium celere]
MELDKDMYSKEEVQELLQALQTELEQTKAQLTEFENVKAQMGELGRRNLENEIRMYMLKQGLNDEMFDLVFSEDIETAKTKIEKLKKLQQKQDMSNAYIPDNVKKDDIYTKAEKQGDVGTMLKAKISKIFD